MRSTILIASIFAILSAGVIAEVLVEQPIVIQDQASVQTPVGVFTQGELIDGAHTEEELLENNFALGATVATPAVVADQGTFSTDAEPIVRTESEIPVEKVVTPEIIASPSTNFLFRDGDATEKADLTSRVFSSDIIRPIVAPSPDVVRPVITTSTDARRTAENSFVFVEEPTVATPAVTRSDILSRSVTRPRVVEIVRKSVDSRAQGISQPIDVDSFFQFLQPAATPATAPVDVVSPIPAAAPVGIVSPIPATAPVEIVSPVPATEAISSVSSGRFFELLQPTAPPTTSPVDIVRPIRVTEPVPSVLNGRFFELLQPTAPPTTSPVDIVRPIRVTEPVPSVLSGRFFEVARPEVSFPEPVGTQGVVTGAFPRRTFGVIDVAQPIRKVEEPVQSRRVLIGQRIIH